MGYRKYFHQHQSSRQEISCVLKYVIFFVNFIFWICGIVCVGLGVYLYLNDFRPVFEAIDFFLNPAILLIMAGCIIVVISFLGCTGALREHVCLLKLFSLSLFLSYICLVILAFIVFILFYSDSKTGISILTVLQNAVAKYGENKNLADLMDTIQQQLSCCGAGSLGYKDWNTSPVYNCSSNNFSPERCGVPYSCCKRSSNQASPNVICGFHAQEKSIAELQNVIYVDGCMQPLQKSFEGHAIIIGAVIGAIIVPVCISVTFSNILAKQIQKQKYLLDKEARREERRRKQERKKRHRDLVVDEASASPRAFYAHEEMMPPKISHVYQQPLPQPPAPQRKLSAEPAAAVSSQHQNDHNKRKKSSTPTGAAAAQMHHTPREGRPKKKRLVNDRKKRDRAASAGALTGLISANSNNNNQKPIPKRRKRRAKSQDANAAAMVGLVHGAGVAPVTSATAGNNNKELRKISSHEECERLQMENRINQEIERANTPVMS